MRMYEIQSIVPFNDVYYIDCSYLAYFTAVKHFNGSVFSYIANDYFVHKLEQTANGSSLKIEKRQVASPSEMLIYNGIGIDPTFDSSNDLIDSIIDKVSNESIVIVPMDGFYYRHPYHDLFYLKEHHYQVMLVYGFDREKEIFKTVDVNGFEWNSKNCCYKHEISFQDLVKCHKEILSYQQNTPSYMKISKDNSNKIVNDDPHFYKSIMIENMKLHKADILKGLQDICTLADNFEQIDIDKTTVFNNKVSSLANKYKMMSVLGNEFNNSNLMEEILKKWIVIEALIYKTDFTGINYKKRISLKLKQLFKLETMLYEDLFSLFDKIS